MTKLISVRPTKKDEFLEDIFQHILIISKGECDITDDMLSEIKDESYFQVLSGLQMLHEDLTLYKEELKAKMEAEFQLEVLKKRNEELAQFNYVASHDLQEPLRTIQSFAKFLLKKSIDKLNENERLYLNSINNSSNRMSELINDLMKYSRVGKSIKYETVDCAKMVNEVLQDLYYTIEKTAPIINIENFPKIKGDRIRLRQVFQNLISNALKFKKPNIPIQINISVEEKRNQYIFCVADNGIGIEEVYIDKIFKIFQRLHNKSEFEGTGIGLALCKKIVEMHNGEIWVESKFNIGSKFFIALPKICDD